MARVDETTIEKVKQWLFDSFYEMERDGDYDYGQPYIECVFDTFNEMMDDFDKTIGEIKEK